MGSARHAYELSCLALAGAEGLVAVFQIFMDESGVHDTAKITTVAAYVGRPQSWKKFTRQWNEAKKPIRVFHAADCANFANEFKGWDKGDRDAYVSNLLPVLARNEIYGISMSFPLPELEAALRPHPGLKKIFGNPYTACFRITARMIVDVMSRPKGRHHRLAFVHEANAYQGEAQDAFNFVRDTRKSGEHFAPMSITFGDKDDYVPLQAADVLAYESNKRVRNPTGQARRSMDAINPRGERCDILYFSKDKLGGLVQNLLRYQRGADAIGLSDLNFYGKVPPFFRTKVP